MEEGVTLVRGRRLERIGGEALADLIGTYAAVIVDIGTGDGRWLYRFARTRPDVLCLGLDANADNLREVSYRASRKPARGGLSNIRFILAPVEAIPAAVHGVADEVWVVYPWGTLLRALTLPEPSILRRIARVLKPGGLLKAAVNASVLRRDSSLGALEPGGRPLPVPVHDDVLRAGYNEAGLRVTSLRSGDMRIQSSWGARLGQGRPVRTLWVEAVSDGDRRDHGGGRDRAGVAGPGPAGASARGHRDAAGVPFV